MIEIDAKNERLLSELERDGRVSNVELARRVGLSPSACLRRVQELETSGVIARYRAVVDRSRLGQALTVFVMVGLSAHLKKDARAFERAMEAAPEVRECHNVTGDVEYLLRVEVRDLVAYKQFHANVLGERSEVNRITSYVCLGSPKDERG
ncbi:MAG: Lrp/AsnC family transcriptional regulator [Pseudomonadota bacterium]